MKTPANAELVSSKASFFIKGTKIQVKMENTRKRLILNSLIVVINLLNSFREVKMESHDETATDPPTLRFQDQTPIAKPDNKRTCAALSPPDEEPVLEKLEATIEKAIENKIPDIVKMLTEDLKGTIRQVINELLTATKNEILGEVRKELKNSETVTLVKALCEDEQLENYNRRDTLKILGFPEQVQRDSNGNSIFENYDKTINNVIQLATNVGANVTPADISIAHRLPTRTNNANRPIIVRFSRRVAKINILRKKKALKDNDHSAKIHVFEDLTSTRVNFMKFMKQHNRINGVWTRDGNLFYQWKNSERVERITSLYEGVAQ